MILIVLLSSLFGVAEHDFHVSITKVDLNPESKRLEIMIKLFTDDLATAMIEKFNTNVVIGTPDEPPLTNDQIKEFVLSQFDLRVNETPLELNYLGKQQEEDATWIFIESDRVGKVRSISVDNPLLTDQFDDQANLVNININGEKEGLTLRKGKVSGSVSFD